MNYSGDTDFEFVSTVIQLDLWQHGQVVNASD